MVKTALSPCRPGHGASCALCCGSHNFAAPFEAVDALFARRRDFYRGFSPDYLAGRAQKSRSAMTGSYHVPKSDPIAGEVLPMIFNDCPRCPYLAYQDDNGIIGCALREDSSGTIRMDCVRSYSGKQFNCGVHMALDDREVRYAAKLTRDWYYYSILIHSSPLLREIMRGHPVPEDVPPDVTDILRKKLARSVLTERGFHEIHSYFT